MEASIGTVDHLDHDSVYADLLEPDAIRLLELYPGPMRAIPLMGSLIVTTLRACEADLVNRYTALSYVWGDDPAPAADTITLAGGSLKLGITANLGAALKDIRHTSEVITVWVDAICINQTDAPERSRQVDLMREIYRNAGSTIVYLGSLNPGMSLLLDAAVARKQQRMGLLEEEEEDADENDDDNNERVGLLRRAVEKDLCSYPWFGRGWVFPELVLSRDPRLQCGERRLPWDDVLDVARPFLGRTEATRRLRDLDTAHSTGARAGQDLRSLVLARRGSHVTDPRDLLFSLMGLAEDGETYRKFLVPDYSKSARQVYIAAAHYMKHEIGLSRFLQSAFTSSVGKKTSAFRLPSWVPDWEVQTPATLTEETTHEPTISSAELLDEGALLPVEELDDFGIVERLTEVFPHGVPCFPPQSYFGKEEPPDTENDRAEWNRFIDPAKNTVTAVADPLEVPEWPESNDARLHYMMGANPTQGPLPPSMACRLALVVKHGGPDNIGTSSSTYYTVSVPVGVAVGDSLISFKNYSFDTARLAAREEEVIYGFRRPLKGGSDRITTDHGEVPLYELAGVHPLNLNLSTPHDKACDRGSLMAFY